MVVVSRIKGVIWAGADLATRVEFRVDVKSVTHYIVIYSSIDTLFPLESIHLHTSVPT